VFYTRRLEWSEVALVPISPVFAAWVHGTRCKRVRTHYLHGLVHIWLQCLLAGVGRARQDPGGARVEEEQIRAGVH
jgi:hypothetical protein